MEKTSAMRQKSGVIPLFVAYEGCCRKQRRRNGGKSIHVIKSRPTFAMSKGTSKDSGDNKKNKKQ